MSTVANHQPNTDEKTLFAVLRPELVQHWPEADWQLEMHAVRARKATLHRLTSDNAPALVVKVYTGGLSAAPLARAQYDALLACNKASRGGNKARAPSVYMFYPELPAILMQWCDARSLSARLWQHFFSPAKRHDFIRSSGAWLAAHHQTSHPEIKPFDTNPLIEKLEKLLQQHRAAQKLMEKDTGFVRGLKLLQSTARTLQHDMPHALLHGDYTPSNILISNGDAIGIDMRGMRRGPIIEDIARMIAYLAISSPSAIAARPSGILRKLEQLILCGYGTPPNKGFLNALRLAVLYQLLRRRLVFAERLHRNKWHLANHLKGWQTRRLIEACLKGF